MWPRGPMPLNNLTSDRTRVEKLRKKVQFPRSMANVADDMARIYDELVAEVARS